MTDHKDILEEAKKEFNRKRDIPNYIENGLIPFSLDKIDWLIVEVEQLRIGGNVNSDLYDQRKDQLEAVEKQRDALLERVQHLLSDPLRQNIEDLTKERDELKEELRISQGIKDGSYTAPKEGWTCYHCGVTFRKPGAASDHFGEVPRAKAKCQYHDLDIERIETDNARLRNELEAAEKKVKELENFAEYIGNEGWERYVKEILK